jgi:hypothetical protein
MNATHLAERPGASVENPSKASLESASKGSMIPRQVSALTREIHAFVEAKGEAAKG